MGCSTGLACPYEGWHTFKFAFLDCSDCIVCAQCIRRGLPLLRGTCSWARDIVADITQYIVLLLCADVPCREPYSACLA